jgi:hypothetical protein
LRRLLLVSFLKASSFLKLLNLFGVGRNKDAA